MAAHTFSKIPKSALIFSFFFLLFPACSPVTSTWRAHRRLMRRSLARSHLGLSISLQHGSSSRSLLPLLAQQAVHQVALLPRSPRFVLRVFPRGSRVSDCSLDIRSCALRLISYIPFHAALFFSIRFILFFPS